MPCQKLSDHQCWRILFALAILPAVALGIFAMVFSGVSPALWGQQTAAFLLCLLCIVPLRHTIKKMPSRILAAVLVGVLASSLLSADTGGAKRWIDLGILNVNTASLLLPMLLILINDMHRPEFLLLCTAGVLCAQPDFSQLIAFMAASLPILFCGQKGYGKAVFCIVAQAVLAIICIRIPTSLEPVAYCESILMMLGELSPLLYLAGVLALVLIPGIWGYLFFKTQQIFILSLEIYYTTTILFGLSGEYPMPFLGFGLSPIMGYWLAGLIIPDMDSKMGK